MKLYKLWNKYIVTIITIITTVIIILYDHLVLNVVEKMLSEVCFDFDSTKRPYEKCKNNSNLGVKCVGMPSGHAQTTTLLSLLLYNYQFISLPICIFFILIVSLQRMFIQAHTLTQVLGGIILGGIYSYIYISTGLYNGLLFMILLTILLILIIMYIIEKELYKPIPSWVDPKMIPNIKKKRESPFYLKFLSILANIYLRGPTFMSWNTLEKQLDIIIEKIKQTNKNMDKVVGIKTGGAIISDYISKKLNLSNDKIKLSRSEYNCDKKPIHTLNDVYQRNVVGNLGEYSVCEGINEDIQDKNIILIDEMITTGKTMNEAIKYLKTEKHANIVYPVCISFSKNRFLYDFNFIYTIKNTVVVWPWGYDN